MTNVKHTIQYKYLPLFSQSMPPFLINLTKQKDLKYFSNVKKKPNNTILLNAKLGTKIQLNQRKKINIIT
jgi:hypothetical protein